MYLKKLVGFTLIEVIVVLSIMGIMLGFIVVRYGTDERQKLQLEGHRLALLMSHAFNTARTTGQLIAWQENVDGYQFLQYSALINQWRKIDVTNMQNYNTLRERQLPEGLHISEVIINGIKSTLKKQEYEMIIFSPNGINPAFELTLKSPHAKVEVKGDMLGSVEDLPAINLQ